MSIITQHQLDQLKYCETAEPIEHANRFPDFMILGPQRTGTTWLADNLRLHPSIFMTHPKEIYFFDMLENREHPDFRTASLNWYLSNFVDSKQHKQERRRQCWQQFRRLYWPRLRGEATACYAAQMTEGVRSELLMLNPNLKCVIMIRNPIKRAWAHAKKDLLNVSCINDQPRELESLPRDEVVSFLNNDYQRKTGDYKTQLENWETALPDGQLQIGFFDDVHNAPEHLVLDTFRFLGVRSSNRFVTEKARKRIAATDTPDQKRSMPGFVEIELKRLFGDQLQFLEDRFSRKLVH